MRAQENPRKQEFSTNAADKAACEGQLNRIYGAIQEYRKRHGGNLPDRLSDLTPEFIRDPNVLICPFAQKRGGLRSWKKQKFRELSPDSFTSYGYEFPPVPLDIMQWRGVPKKTWRDFKQRAMEKLGPVVPIVRCHDHRPWLNLAFGGQIYESQLYWERNFTEDKHLLIVPKLFATPAPPLTAADFPRRDPRADARLLDLTEYYNASLTNAWQGFPGNHLAALPNGLHEFGSVQFDVRGVIQLRGNDLPATFPTRVDGIKVNQKCRYAYFLHAVGFTYLLPVTNGFFRLHYADGEAEHVPLIHGKHIGDWWFDPKTSSEPTHAKVVWVGENEATKAYGQRLRLYQFTWANPRPDVEVKTLSFDCGARAHAPFLLAVTVE